MSYENNAVGRGLVVIGDGDGDGGGGGEWDGSWQGAAIGSFIVMAGCWAYCMYNEISRSHAATANRRLTIDLILAMPL